ncbi:non-specific serine/threonine protein kinase [Kibdelosporangium banguiense]|uniref:Non-specific serine/threonine protein kinase n=1 Tax=Kibdelosporangium banguiense TaxID=1365924 RepID=A0ABS4TJJ2_9PSEU|nr:LuxR C-terminal-related transcriptional regulator [Kibdelosporangium banguiense]MBP2324582.1 non-specific serine/threonine protein kinase [Kibdelosporangium banguiense]
MGRRPEMAEVKRLLSQSRLVTLTGVGGVGKTRLGVRVAATRQRAFADGAWLVELGQVHQPALVSHTVMVALGLRDQSLGRTPVELLADYLVPRQVLLVLDSCEQVVDAVAKMVHVLLRFCPHVRVLATSRESLGIDGETVLPVQPLPVPDPERPIAPRRKQSLVAAMALFADRAAAVVPEFVVTQDNWGTVAQICQRLEGVPLAIELAATQLRALSADEILRRLDDRYRLLTGGASGVPERQRTLRACMEWSYGLCAPLERLLWARVSVFAGSFEMDAAEDICTDQELPEEDVLDLVHALIDKSILTREEHEGPARYRLLDAIRDFGREKLGETGEDLVLRRHRDWYQQLIQRADADVISARQVEWQARLDRELSNVRAALEFSLTEPGEADVGLRMAVALGWYWFRGLLGEGRQWLDQALARQSGPPTITRLEAVYLGAFFAGFQGDVEAAPALATQAQTLAEQVNTPLARALATHLRGHLAAFSRDLGQAAACYEEVIDAYRAEGNLPRLCEALMPLILAAGLPGDVERATASYEELLAITQPQGEALYRSFALHHLGVVLLCQGECQRPAGLVEEGLRLARLVGAPLNIAFCMASAAWVALRERHARRAATLLGAVQKLYRTLGTPPGIWPDLVAHHEECERKTRRALGAREYQVAFQHGTGLSVAETIAYALRETPEQEPAPTEAEAVLTRREQQVVELITQGLSNKEIAARLLIAQRTAEGHVEHVLAKLGLSSRTQIAAWAARQQKPS